MTNRHRYNRHPSLGNIERKLNIMAAGHKEYALPAGRKIDPSFDMGLFRTAVAQIMHPLAKP